MSGAHRPVPWSVQSSAQEPQHLFAQWDEATHKYTCILQTIFCFPLLLVKLWFCSNLFNKFEISYRCPVYQLGLFSPHHNPLTQQWTRLFASGFHYLHLFCPSLNCKNFQVSSFLVQAHGNGPRSLLWFLGATTQNTTGIFAISWMQASKTLSLMYEGIQRSLNCSFGERHWNILDKWTMTNNKWASTVQARKREDILKFPSPVAVHLNNLCTGQRFWRTLVSHGNF